MHRINAAEPFSASVEPSFSVDLGSTPLFTPAFRVDEPANWSVRSTLEFSHPLGEVRVSVFEERVTDGTDSSAYAAAYGTLYEKHFPGYRELSPPAESALLEGFPSAVARRLRWQPADGPALLQVQVYGTGSGRGVVATASGPESLIRSDWSELEQALGHIRATDPAIAAAAIRAGPTDSPATRFDEGRMTIAAATPESSATDQSGVVCSPDELLAIAIGFGLDRYPGIDDAGSAGVDDESARLRAARRGLRARALVELEGTSARLSTAAMPLLIPIRAHGLVTSGVGEETAAWFVHDDRIAEVRQVDSGLVRVREMASDRLGDLVVAHLSGAASGTNGSLARAGWSPTGYLGTRIGWRRAEDGFVTEHDTAAVSARALTARVLDSISAAADLR